jgi:hypothetical protein
VAILNTLSYQEPDAGHQDRKRHSILEHYFISLKMADKTKCQWLMPITLATSEAEIGRITV